jgi:hypothetical protein
MCEPALPSKPRARSQHSGVVGIHPPPAGRLPASTAETRGRRPWWGSPQPSHRARRMRRRGPRWSGSAPGPRPTVWCCETNKNTPRLVESIQVGTTTFRPPRHTGTPWYTQAHAGTRKHNQTQPSIAGYPFTQGKHAVVEKHWSHLVVAAVGVDSNSGNPPGNTGTFSGASWPVAVGVATLAVATTGGGVAGATEPSPEPSPAPDATALLGGVVSPTGTPPSCPLLVALPLLAPPPPARAPTKCALIADCSSSTVEQGTRATRAPSCRSSKVGSLVTPAARLASSDVVTAKASPGPLRAASSSTPAAIRLHTVHQAALYSRTRGPGPVRKLCTASSSSTAVTRLEDIFVR